MLTDQCLNHITLIAQSPDVRMCDHNVEGGRVGIWECGRVGVWDGVFFRRHSLPLFLPPPLPLSSPPISLSFLLPLPSPLCPETSRLCHSPLVLEGIESVYFRGPSFMGERVSLQSSVNKVFSTRRQGFFCVTVHNST